MDELRKAGKKPYLSNSEGATMSLTVCCETICVKEMGDLQEVNAVGRKGLSFKNKKQNKTKKQQPSENPSNLSITT